jgi:5-methyltetrahydrofolate--homocysteine methyltransferase
MMRKQINTLLSQRVLFLDGAIGTELIKQGHGDIPPERAILQCPSAVEKIQRSYVAAGSDILLTATLGANPIKLQEYRLADKMEVINTQATAISRKASRSHTLVAGNLGPTGDFFPPSGQLTFETAYQCYERQVTVLLESGIDLFVLETFFDIRELKAAVLATRDNARDSCIIANLTFNKDGRTLTGTDPTGFALAFEDLDVDALGINCSLGPEEIIPIFQELSRTTGKYLSVKPNAGIPQIVQGKQRYRMSPPTFAKYAEDFIELGTNFIGGCCGTGPEHIQLLTSRFGRHRPVKRTIKPLIGISSLSRNTIFNPETAPVIIGERINPTGKKRMTEELEKGMTESIRKEAQRQAAAGAQVLDLNLGMEAGISESFLRHLIMQLLIAPGLPLSIDLRSEHLIKIALQAYGGRALLNSISLSDFEDKIELLKRYGGMVVFLPIDENGVPSTARERAELAQRALTALEERGFKRERILFDPIVMTLSTGNDPHITLDTLRLLKQKGYRTVLGLSNISYGLPHRSSINRYFLKRCTSIGTDAVIMNPSEKEGTVDIDLAPVFDGKKDIRDFISEVTIPKVKTPSKTMRRVAPDPVFKSIVDGEKEKIDHNIALLLEHKSYDRIIEKSLRPALDEVGKRYEKREIFLPQLIMSAEAAQAAFAYIEQRFAQKETGKGRVIIATVKGDIHDIGKNIVAMMLKNAGFEVSDLGKDVPSEDIVRQALQQKAHIIALSALMTTTALKMKEVIEIAKKRGISAKVMIGGACVTRKFAQEIRADAFASDASEAVKEAGRLLKKVLQR